MKSYQIFAIAFGIISGVLFGILLFFYFFVIIGGYTELNKFAQIVAKIDLYSFIIYTTFSSILGIILCSNSRSYVGLIAGIFTGVILGLIFKIIGYFLYPNMQVEWTIFHPIGCYRGTIGAIICLPSGTISGAIANSMINLITTRRKRDLIIIERNDKDNEFSDNRYK